MENRKLPNETAILVLGIISFIACCCSSGLGGLIFSGIAYYLAIKSEKLYQLNPDQYDNYGKIKTGKIVAIVGLVLAVLTLIYTIYSIYNLGGIDAYMEKVQETMDQLQNQ